MGLPLKEPDALELEEARALPALAAHTAREHALSSSAADQVLVPLLLLLLLL